MAEGGGESGPIENTLDDIEQLFLTAGVESLGLWQGEYTLSYIRIRNAAPIENHNFERRARHS